MDNYRIIYPIRVGATKQTEGVIPLSEEDAAGLLACGAIEPTDETPTPKTKRGGAPK